MAKTKQQKKEAAIIFQPKIEDILRNNAKSISNQSYTLGELDTLEKIGIDDREREIARGLIHRLAETYGINILVCIGE